jgi:hypothetical protein
MESDDQMIVIGPMMIPDKVILRKAEDGSFFEVVFTKEDITMCKEKFATLGLQGAMNVNHWDPSATATMVGHWQIADEKMDKAVALGFENLPVGTWMGEWKVRDEGLWKRIKSGELTGFSIEGWFDLTPVEGDTEAEPAKVEQKQITNLNMSKEKTPSIGGYFRQQLRQLFGAKGKVLMADHVLKDGTKIQVDDETGEVFLIDAEGNRGEKAPDATHELDSGELLVVYGGLAVLTTTSHVGAAVETAIQVIVAGGKTRDEALAEITTATELTADEIAKVLDGSFGCLLMDKRDLLATALGITADDLKAAAELDGCTDEAVEPVETVEELPAEVALQEAFRKGVKAAMKIQLSEDTKLVKLGKIGVKAAAGVLADGAIIYIDINSGCVYSVTADLWIEDYLPAGSYTTVDGKTIVVFEKKITYDEGTNYEWSYTISMIDYAASTLEPKDYMPWIEEAATMAEAEMTALKASHVSEVDGLKAQLAEAQGKFASITTELEKAKTELKEVSGRPIKGTYTKTPIEIKAKVVSPAKQAFLEKFNSQKP